MLKHRIIPILLWDGKQAVQTVKFSTIRPVGSMMQHIEVMESRSIDELIILDIKATKEKREPSFKLIKTYASRLFCPVTYGGGISKIDHVKKLIQDCGVDKISIKHHCHLIRKAANQVGSQSVVYSLDVLKNKVDGCPQRYYDKFNIKKWAKLVEAEGAGEILLTDINKNGTQKCYNKLLIKDVCDVVTIPVIANGGCCDELDMIHAIKCGASAVAASSLFLFTERTPRSCARTLQEAGLPMRVE